MFLWLGLKEVILITKQDELNSPFYKVDNFIWISQASLLNMMLNAMEEYSFSSEPMCSVYENSLSIDYFQVTFPKSFLTFFSTYFCTCKVEE